MAPLRRSFRPIRPLVPLAALLSLVLLQACSDVRAGEGSASGPAWEAAEELRVGSVDDPEYSFTWFRDAAVGPEGRIYTLHPQESRGRIFSPEGELLGTFGGPGDGPGEFRNVTGLGWRGDSLWVLDARGYRFTFFDADGRLLHTVAPRVELGDRESRPPRPRAMGPDSLLLARPPLWSSDVADGRITMQEEVRMTRSGEVVDTVLRIPVGPSILAIRDPDAERPTATVYTSQPWGDGPLLAEDLGVGRFFVVERPTAETPDETSFRVVARTVEGDTLWDRSYRYEPRPLRPEEVDRYAEETGERIAGYHDIATPAEIAAWTRDALYVPDYHPPVRRALAGRDGTLWLERDAESSEGTVWLVLDEAGEPVGEVALPERFRPLVVDRGRAWGSITDELDVRYVARFRVGPPEG